MEQLTAAITARQEEIASIEKNNKNLDQQVYSISSSIIMMVPFS